MLSIQARFARYYMARKLKHAPNHNPLPHHSRRLLAQALGYMPVPKGLSVTQIQVGHVPVEIIRPAQISTTHVLMYIHGGGYVAGSPETHRAFTARLARELGCEIWVPDYRLAPEHPFPAGLHDVADVWVAFIQQHQGKRVILGGESAGGGLSLALCYFLREQGLAMPDQLYLLSPWLDIRMAGDSYRRNNARDVICDAQATEMGFARHYAGMHARTNPLMSPVLGDPAGLPPTLIQFADQEIFEDDSRALIRQAHIAGVNIVSEIGHGLWHAWPLFAPFIPESNQAIRQLGRWVREYVPQTQAARTEHQNKKGLHEALSDHNHAG